MIVLCVQEEGSILVCGLIWGSDTTQNMIPTPLPSCTDPVPPLLPARLNDACVCCMYRLEWEDGAGLGEGTRPHGCDRGTAGRGHLSGYGTLHPPPWTVGVCGVGDKGAWDVLSVHGDAERRGKRESRSSRQYERLGDGWRGGRRERKLNREFR